MTFLKKLIFYSTLCIFSGLLLPSAWAQSAACNANEDVATFNFGAVNATSASASTRNWPAGSTSNSYNVANFGSVAQNTISFVVTTSTNAPLLETGAGSGVFSPNLRLRGNVADSLDLRMDAVNSGNGNTLTVAFNRPMDKLRFIMLDLDIGGFQDSLRVSGFLNGIVVPLATFVPSSPANNMQSTIGTFRSIKTTGGGNCGDADASCNVQVNFASPVDSVVIGFLAGPDNAAPGIQQVAFNTFSYCVPKRELSLRKVDVTPTFVVGTNGTYTLSITNQGGAATNAPVVFQDILQLPGVSFVNPQPASAGFSCVVSTTTYAGDTVNCNNPAALAASSLTTVTLSVIVANTVTASNFDNKAKVAGGGDPNKATLASTGPVSGCVAGNEGQAGGGATYFSGAATQAGCAFENTLLVRQAELGVVKSNGTATLVAGTSTTYTVTFANLGPSSADNAVVSDVASAGLSACTVLSCNSSGAASCPVTPANLLAPGGTTLPTLPPNTVVTFLVRRNVTAIGL